MTAGSETWHAIDERDASGIEMGELGFEVGSTEGDVMEAFSTARDEPADRGVGAQRLDQLHRADEGHPNASILEELGRGTRLTGDELEASPTLFDGADGHGHVVERSAFRHGIHGRDGRSGRKRVQGEV